jgi:outer membrane protein W
MLPAGILILTYILSALSYLNITQKGAFMKVTTIKPVLATILVAASLGIVAMASAEDLPGDYVALKAGIYSPSTSHNLDNFNAGNRSHLDSKTGFAGEVAFGHYFLPILAIELGGGYFETKGSPLAQPGELKLKVIPLIATGKVSLPIGIFEPYGLAGIGAYITDLSVNKNASDANTLKGSTKVTYGLHAGVGLNINFQKNMFVGVEGKYLWADPSFGGEHYKLDGFISTAVVGFRL